MLTKPNRILLEVERALLDLSYMKRLSSACFGYLEGTGRMEKGPGRNRTNDGSGGAPVQPDQEQERLRQLIPLRENLKRVHREAGRQRRICSATAAIDQIDLDQLEGLGRRYRALVGLLPKIRALGQEKEAVAQPTSETGSSAGRTGGKVE